ncbi:tetratricopeptide repeat protein [Telmatobacter sp. DSM 110680]|uniref:Tetratricopeptide repeat protein n=1 Tax=Telmatobacter sp. DSM 110680 TaxID=3036704 RepID=A0AAU7DHG0_9BACT
MTDTSSPRLGSWTYQRALMLMSLCLLAGIAGGWTIRGIHPASADPARVVSAPQVTPTNTTQAPIPTQLKAMVDNQAAPQILRLKSDPRNVELLTSIGNVYYDAQQYPTAIDYYGRVLQLNASDAAVRTDMATAYWYIGNIDTAIAEFNTALTFAPNNANTLFNLGLVKWQGKHDSAGAIADWKKLLATNPNYEAKDKVEKMLADVEKQVAAKPGTKG